MMQRESLRERDVPQAMKAVAEVIGRLDHIEKERRKRESLPRVMRFDQVPYTQNRSGQTRMLLNMPHWKFEARNGPIYTMAIMEQVRAPGAHGGKHRHFGEALFYILEGKGYEIHDEVRYEWEGGDLMAVPSHTVHQHFGSSSGTTRMLAVIPTLNEFMGLGKREQIEIEPQNYNIPDEVKARLGTDEEYQKMIGQRLAVTYEQVPEVKTTYDYYLELLAKENDWRQRVPHVVKGKDVPWEETRQGRIKFLLHLNSQEDIVGLRLFDAFIQEIPPGGYSGRHRHVGEEVHIILEGKGYDIHDGVRHDWEEDNLVCIPIHTMHQHFNADPERPARFLGVQTRLHIFAGHGGIEHFEDASK